jgi:hypothetical protein
VGDRLNEIGALSLLFKKKDVNGKFAWWILTLQEYSIDIQHSHGTANVVADAYPELQWIQKSGQSQPKV